MPLDREADVVVVSQANVCIGGTATQHNLDGLKGHRLRTHGGTSEAKVPVIVNRPLNAMFKSRLASTELSSYQVFDLAINGTE